MSTGLIIAIVVVAALILLALLVLLPRMRRKAQERKAVQRMEQRRTRAVEHHRSEADERAYRAEMAEQEARQARAEADVHESRASMHERGMADDELPEAGDDRFERDRRLAAEQEADRTDGTERRSDASEVETTTRYERETR